MPQEPLSTLTGRSVFPRKTTIPNQKCMLCTCSSDRPLCQFCQSEITRYRTTNCAGNLMNLPEFQTKLPKLKGHKLFSLGPHDWPLDHLISNIKYQQKSMLIPELAHVFVEQFRESGLVLPDALLAVPMHPMKLWLRGFNQTALLAEHIANELRIPLIENVAIKRWNATPQVQKNAAARRKLRLNSFRIRSQAMPYKEIAIFDDVITTGSTIGSLARAFHSGYPNVTCQLWSCSISLKQR